MKAWATVHLEHDDVEDKALIDVPSKLSLFGQKKKVNCLSQSYSGFFFFSFDTMVFLFLIYYIWLINSISTNIFAKFRREKYMTHPVCFKEYLFHISGLRLLLLVRGNDFNNYLTLILNSILTGYKCIFTLSKKKSVSLLCS